MRPVQSMDEQAVWRFWQSYARVAVEVSELYKRCHDDYLGVITDYANFGPYLARDGLVSA